MTKEEFLKRISMGSGNCNFTSCQECPYFSKTGCGFGYERARVVLAKILLRTFPKQKTQLAKLKEENEKLKDQIARMKCCSNCKHVRECRCKFACECGDYSYWEFAE
jgi:hypothetical protein